MHTQHLTLLSCLLHVCLCRSIKLWRGSEAAGELTGHEGPVLCLTATPDGQLISGSGDGTLRRWQGNRCMHVYRGHQDSVR